MMNMGSRGLCWQRSVCLKRMGIFSGEASEGTVAGSGTYFNMSNVFI